MRRTVLALALAVAACSPEAETPDAAEKSRPGNPFFGVWRTETAQVAPWWNGPGGAPEMNPDFQNTPITFAADKSSGPKLIACDAPVYTVSLVRPEGLFEGNLPAPAMDAASLGFPARDILSLNLSCTQDNKDVSLDFAMADDATVMLGLDNMIYTLKRQ
jgi:hypothetical protein